MKLVLLKTFRYDKAAELVIMPEDKLPVDAVCLGLNWYLKFPEYVSGPADMIEEYKKVFTDGDNL